MLVGGVVVDEGEEWERADEVEAEVDGSRDRADLRHHWALP
jgi:hypothetical protein